MIITYRELSPSLRLIVTAPCCLLLALAITAAAPAFRQVLTDPATQQPTSLVSLSGPNWTGTLDAARLPADPVAGRDVAPSSVNADGVVQAATGFATGSGFFAANDSGVYLYGQQIADDNGCLFAANRIAAPAVYVQTVGFPDGSVLFVDGTQLTWTDQQGGAHVLAFGN